MGHDHSHDSGHHHHAPESFNLAFGLAVFLNLAFTLIEAGYAIYANSMSLLADAGHNLGDVAGLILAWGASWLLTKPSTERYSYGYKRSTILAAILNALLLVGTSAIIGYESISKLFSPEAILELPVIIVATIGIAINGGTALLFLRGSKDDLNIKSAYIHLASDALISVGVVVAGTIIYFTGWYIIDPILGLLIVVAILAGTWGLLRDSLNLLMDGVPHSIDRPSVKQYLQQLSGVDTVHDLHIWGLSTKEIALTVHLVMPEKSLSDAEYSEVSQQLKQRFNIDHTTIQVENGTDEHPCPHETSCGEA